MDTGACESVGGFDVATYYPTVHTEALKSQISQSATGDTMPNYGEKTLLVRTPTGKWTVLKKHICNCTDPSTSVAKVCDKGNFAGFGRDGGFILNLADKSVGWIHRDQDTCEMEMEILQYNEATLLFVNARL